MLCNECRSENVCKYISDMENVVDSTMKLKGINNIMSPISVEVKCKHFEKKGQKQDGIWNTQK